MSRWVQKKGPESGDQDPRWGLGITSCSDSLGSADTVGITGGTEEAVTPLGDCGAGCQAEGPLLKMQDGVFLPSADSLA